MSSTGSVTTSGILIYNVDTANANLDEKFDLEDFRLQIKDMRIKKTSQKV